MWHSILKGYLNEDKPIKTHSPHLKLLLIRKYFLCRCLHLLPSSSSVWVCIVLSFISLRIQYHFARWKPSGRDTQMPDLQDFIDVIFAHQKNTQYWLTPNALWVACPTHPPGMEWIQVVYLNMIWILEISVKTNINSITTLKWF